MITFILVLSLIFLLAYSFHLFKKNYKYWQNLGIACEEPTYFLGNVKGLGTQYSFAELLLHYYNKFKNCKPFAGFYWFFKPLVFAVDPALLKLILIKDFAKFTDRGLYVNEKDDPLSGILVNLEGHKWRNMRNKLSPTFSSGKMKIMYPIVVSISDEFMKVFGQAAAENAEIEVSNLMARFTIDVIGSCAFGLEINSLKDPNNNFYKMGHKALLEERFGRLGLILRSNFPTLARILHWKKTVQEVEDFFIGVVKQTVSHREQNNIRRNDFMDMLIELKNNKLMKSKTGVEEMTSLTIEEIAAQAFVFLVAGFETSSTAMSFALYELAQQQDIQQKAREEIRQVLKKYNNQLTYEALKEMVYLEQILFETLRLYTIIPILNRIALEDYPVPGHPGYVIKKGMKIFIPAAAIHRDERYYPQPNYFNPDNFSPKNVATRDSVTYLPFGDGPRNCIGLRFGKMQSLVGLSQLLRHFKFEVCPKTQIPIKYNKNNVFVSSENGIYLKITKLENV